MTTTPDQDPEPWCTDEPAEDEIILVTHTIDEEDDRA